MLRGTERDAVLMEEPRKHGVVAVLRDEAGRFLIIRRALTLKRAPGWWCFLGGEVEAGETYHEAIVREVQEEAGLTVRALEKIHESISPNGEFRLHWLTVDLQPATQTMQLNPREVAEARWVTIPEALLLQPTLPALTAWFKARSNGPPA